MNNLSYSLCLIGCLSSVVFISAPVSSEENAPSNIILNGIIRDFSDSHPDFERTPGEASADGSVFEYGLDHDITTNSLSSDFKPQYVGGSYSTTNEENFSQWYQDVAGVNESTEFSITLVEQNDGVYRYENTNFFPINDQLIGNEGRQNNYHFTYQLSSSFTYQGGEVFDFSGDDDVWVYINGSKVIDIGGVHSRQDASVSLDAVATDIGLELGNDYRFDFFFAERHTTKSNFVIETTIELAGDLIAD